MLERLKSLEDRYHKLNELLSDPEVVNDPNKLRYNTKEQSDLEDVVQAYRTYQNVVSELDDAKEMLHDDLDEEMREMAKDEIAELTEQEEKLREELKVLLLP